ncbi:MAG TPA: PEP-CTERM sorting domain-containing protein [Kamptonema sp.]|nr:PEP-CTERM sorting domain-containing protein [Kamptonema sp.]
MKLIRKATLTAALLATAAIVGKATPAQAFSLYFGEDLSQNENIRLTTTPKANAARNDFLSQLVGVGTETFESYNASTGAPLSIGFGNAGTATMGGSGYVERTPSGTSLGRYPISGDKYWLSTGQFSITFSKQVAAFGFYGTDIGDFNGQLTLTLINSLTNFSQTILVPHTIGSNGRGGGSALYFGLIASQNEVFDRILFGNTAPGTDVFGFDNMTIGALDQVVQPQPEEPVPEPLTMAGMALGGAMLAGARRVRQGRQKA